MHIIIYHKYLQHLMKHGYSECGLTECGQTNSGYTDSGSKESGYTDIGSKDAAKGNAAYRNAAKRNDTVVSPRENRAKSSTIETEQRITNIHHTYMCCIELTKVDSNCETDTCLFITRVTRAALVCIVNHSHGINRVYCVST